MKFCPTCDVRLKKDSDTLVLTCPKCSYFENLDTRKPESVPSCWSESTIDDLSKQTTFPDVSNLSPKQQEFFEKQQEKGFKKSNKLFEPLKPPCSNIFHKKPTCPECNGTGCNPGSSKSTCYLCKGYGYVCHICR